MCGPDGCGGTCGTCTLGSCNNTTGQCQSQCTTGQTQCTNLNTVQNCVNGLWQTGSCPNYNVCVQGGCAPVCDGWLSTQTNPSVCYFPVQESYANGLFLFTNDSTKLSPTTTADGVVWDGTQNALISTTNGTSWPWAWTMFGLGSADVALAQFRIVNIAPPVNNTYIYFRARRTGSFNNNKTTRYNVSAGNPNGIFASLTPTASYLWTNHNVFSGNLTNQFSNSGWNYWGISPIGDGLGGSPDTVELSWFMLEVVP
jgi:hypothetical protein